MTLSFPPRAWLFAIVVVVAVAAPLAAVPVLEAHGKDVEIEITSFAPDPDDPTTRLYRAEIAYLDGDPVQDARVEIWTARHGGGPEVDIVVLEALAEPGVYVGEVTFPVFGTWDVQISVSESGSGQAGFEEDVQPAVRSLSEGEAAEVRRRVLEIFFTFNLRDVANIVVRIAHSVGGIAVYGSTIAVVGAYALLGAPSRAMFFRRLSRYFLPAMVAGMAVLALSGAYSAAYGAPIKAPGIYDIDVMLKIPYGPAYMGTMAFKLAAFLASGVILLMMSRELKLAAEQFPQVGGGSQSALIADVTETSGDSAVSSPLFRLAVANATLGLTLTVAVVVIMYLHNLSHLAVFIPE